jgi:predicted dehydrogenase/threonine dehydrogenase-like Zn-dependent dehydrogenase
VDVKQVLIKGGGVVVQDVPAPTVGPRNILVRVRHSCVSVGTEMSSVKMSGLPLYRRALKQPHHVKRALKLMADNGVKRTYDMIKGRLDAGLPAGYSAAGEVVAVGEEVGEFKPGDIVACAGAGIANHAELIDVPVNLANLVPEGLDTEVASTVTLGAIAMQGVRRANPTFGETIVVIGLGILGQITAQLLKAAGCVIVGTDVDPQRVQIARANGMDHGLTPADGSLAERVTQLSNGFGADGVIITAASQSSEIVAQAFQACRRKGRVVLVGDVGLNIDRNDMYVKELDFLISTSYGPGRYDPVYEEEGRDYPLAYVRWTENRNMQEYLRLLSTGALTFANMPREVFPVTEATQAYESLKSAAKPLLVVLQYPHREEAVTPSVVLREARAPHTGKIRLALCGAGGFALGMHLPNLAKLTDQFQLTTVMSRTGANAVMAANRFGAAKATTDFDEVLRDPDIDLVLIATRHDQHAAMTLKALEAGKNVFVEKPLAIHEAQLAEIEEFFRDKSSTPVLMTGFNRRFAPGVAALLPSLRARKTPLIANYRMNAGFIPNDHWVHGPQGGGRNIGEACHIYDLFNALTGSTYESVEAMSIVPNSKHWRRDDNFVATARYRDGSVCTLTYTALGDKSYAKERCEIFADGKVYSLDDFKSTSVSTARKPLWKSWTIEKGQREELQALAKTIREGAPWPISLEDQIAATRMSFDVENQLAG